jgi:lipoprotein-anchoring transpeptidase ErfK/SrfK
LFIGVLVIVGLFIFVGGIMLFSGGQGDGEQQQSVSNSLEKADAAFSKGDFIEAKKLYKLAMNEEKDLSVLGDMKNKIEEINMKLIFSSRADGVSVEYVVVPNDVLVNIAKKFNTTVNLIKKANNLESDVIRVGQKLKINNSKFSMAIDKSQNILFLKRGEEIMKTYVVATGKDNSTPVGNFKIVNKLVRPTWFRTGAVISPDSPENILGSRWMGFNIEGYGIHGTIEPDKMGQQVTLGCVRMKNEDVEELFDVVPVGTEVTIVN